MIIGVPKEIKLQEYRVGATPAMEGVYRLFLPLRPPSPKTGGSLCLELKSRRQLQTRVSHYLLTKPGMWILATTRSLVQGWRIKLCKLNFAFQDPSHFPQS